MNRCLAGEQGHIRSDYQFDPCNVPTFTLNPGDVYRVVRGERDHQDRAVALGRLI